MKAPSHIAGIRWGSTCAGVRRLDRDDLAVMAIAEGSTCAAVFTRNRFAAASVILAREHLALTPPRFVLVNSGNANAGTGDPGMRDALATCRALAVRCGCAAEAVLPFSTGVIGEPLPVSRIIEALPRALEALSGDGWAGAARAIMTTDTVPKTSAVTVSIGGAPVTVTGIAKGAGMIAPDMATLLAFVATDATVSQPVLDACLKHAAAQSFNRITVDGDTSTNDACVLVATARAPAQSITEPAGAAYQAFSTAVTEVCRTLAQGIVRDGEGATKFVTINVTGCPGEGAAVQIARAVANSPLVKTALYASDPNWGRILAAAGRAVSHDIDAERLAIHLNGLCVFRDGARAAGPTEEDARAAMAVPEIVIAIDLGSGRHAATVWTCDLSYDYVRINAEYRS
ncbi:MAG: bifunctional glutamate N-acetyltransferase/amino-acid acetyltransferase ArgJ [Gammaproteobacteria bacterium]